MFKPVLGIKEISVIVKVNRGRSPQEAIRAAGWMKSVDREVVDAMPNGEGDEVEVVLVPAKMLNLKKFSMHDGFIRNRRLAHELRSWGFRPADPYSVAAVVEAIPALTSAMSIFTFWKETRSNWHYSLFVGDHDGFGARVSVAHHASRYDVWYTGVWFACFRT